MYLLPSLACLKTKGMHYSVLYTVPLWAFRLKLRQGNAHIQLIGKFGNATLKYAIHNEVLSTLQVLLASVKNKDTQHLVRLGFSCSNKTTISESILVEVCVWNLVMKSFVMFHLLKHFSLLWNLVRIKQSNNHHILSRTPLNLLLHFHRRPTNRSRQSKRNSQEFKQFQEVSMILWKFICIFP